MMLDSRKLLGVVVVLLGLALLVLWLRPRTPWAAPEAISPDVKSLYGSPLDLAFARADQLKETLERPLFEESRRPQPKETKQEGPDDLNRIELSGLFESVAGRGGIIFTQNGKTWRIHTGEKIGSWVLEHVQGNRAMFKRAGSDTRKSLSLKFKAQPESVPTSASHPGGEKKAAASPDTAETPSAPVSPVATPKLEQSTNGQ